MAYEAKKVALMINKDLSSNGTLIRCAPLAVWGSNLMHNRDFKKLIVSESELTHAHPVVHELTFVYCAAIKVLVTSSSKDRIKDALDLATKLSRNSLADTKHKDGTNSKDCL